MVFLWGGSTSDGYLDDLWGYNLTSLYAAVFQHMCFLCVYACPRVYMLLLRSWPWDLSWAPDIGTNVCVLRTGHGIRLRLPLRPRSPVAGPGFYLQTRLAVPL